MHCQDMKECFEHINAYANGKCTGFPLIVCTDNFRDYQTIMQHISADETKKCIYASDHVYENGLPNIQETVEAMTGEGSYVVSGLSQSLMLQGEAELDLQIDKLIGCSISGHAIVLLNHCKSYLEKYLQRDIRLKGRIVFLDGEVTPLPQIQLAKSKDECVGKYDKNIQKLLYHLERITDTEIAAHPTITVLTSFTPSFFRKSMYAISQSGGVYDALIRKYSDLAYTTDKAYGAEDEWNWLLKRTSEYSTFSKLVSTIFGSTTNLVNHLGDVLDTGDEKTKWLLWLSMKVFGSESNGYLSLVLSHSQNNSDFVHHIYQDLLDVHYEDKQFDNYYRERKQLIAKIPENLPEITSYCSSVGKHAKNGVFYLTNLSEDEEFAFMECIDHYEWTDDELLTVIKHAFPNLALYMRDFVFDKLNTKLSEKDTPFRATLTEYFHRYKIQKVKNHIEEPFMNMVNQFAIDRPFFKLQPRSSVVTAMDKKGVQAFFFDALGVEYLPYIQAKCEEYGMVYEINIAHCELPSITCKNKEFQKRFETKDIGDLDELKHHSQIYNYETCPYPIHVFRELEIIDHELHRIRLQLIQRNFDRAVILSDHGASRLAVIYKHENESKLELEEKGVHSGRCCPCPEDPKIPQAAFEDGFAVLGNYERFKGSRKANLEVHGGASLEEVIVPIITLSLRPDNVEYCFVDPVVKFKVGQPSTIELFSNVPMKKPRLEIEGIFYDGAFTSDSKHAIFTLTEQKRVREYTATVYEGNGNTGVVLSFRIERGTKTKNLFGL